MIVVTNAIDRLVYRFHRKLRWSREHFLGYFLSKTARAADEIGRLLGVHPSAVYCPMMGERGENVVPIFSRVRVNGEPMKVPIEARNDVREYVRDIPFELAKAPLRRHHGGVTSAGVTRSFSQ